MTTSSYQENLKIINSLNLTSGQDFGINVIINRTIMITPTTKNDINGNPELVPLLAFSPESCLSEYKDVTLIHEINHCIEFSLLSFNEGKPIFKCGYETIDDYDENHVRKYEQFSETQNQLIAMEVTRLMHEDNVYIFDDPKISRIKGGTSYEQQKMFCTDLWQNYKNEIIESRIGPNLNPILNSIGEHSFEEINNIINEYTQIPYYSLMDDIINDRKTELTEKREQLIEKYLKIINQILEMKEQTTINPETSNKIM